MYVRLDVERRPDSWVGPSIEVGRICRNDHIFQSPNPEVRRHEDQNRILSDLVCRDLPRSFSVYDLIIVSFRKCSRGEPGVVCFIQGAIQLNQIL